jgi:hypothetical protein
LLTHLKQASGSCAVLVVEIGASAMSKDLSLDLPALLGKKIDDPNLTAFLKELDKAEAVRLTS